MPTSLWTFQARLVKVIDGDTLDICLDAAFRRTGTERLRLLGVNTPELKGATRPAGLAATYFVKDWLSEALGDWPLIVRTEKSDAFGRYLAWVWRRSDERCLNSDIIEAGHGVVFMPE